MVKARIRTAVLSALAIAIGLAGCPPGHPPGPRGDACESIGDCNAVTCGNLVPCVRGFCLSDAPPVIVPCHDAGLDASAYECDFYYECNDEPCGPGLIPCIGGRCNPGAPRLDVPCDAGPGGCSDDVDCVVALPFDRCCGGCPEAMSVEEIALDPCRYDADVIPPGRGPDECYLDCEPCVQCEEPPIAAECSGGACAPIAGPCEAFSRGEETLPAAEAAARAPELVGRRITVEGTAFPGEVVCEFDLGCDPGPRCSGPILLDGVVELRGSSCGVFAKCTDAECAKTVACRPLDDGVAYRVTGDWRFEGVYYLDLVSYEAI